jgi:hypothetical protein
LHAYWIGVVDISDQERRANGFADIDDLEKFRADAQKMLARLKEDWKNGNIAPYSITLNNLLLVRGYRLELSAADERLLCLQFVRAAMAGYELLLARDEGRDPLLSLSVPPLAAGNLNATAIQAVTETHPPRQLVKAKHSPWSTSLMCGMTPRRNARKKPSTAFSST